MFDKVLVANRGEIAVRVMRTCRDMGIATAAVYSDADRDALHVRFADQAVHVGPGPATESYLNIDAVVSAALSVGAQAVHPGYGFLSENANFAEACAAAGITFIGPSPEILRLLGDKSEAKKRAQSAGVPVVPGYYVEGLDEEAIAQRAGEIGYPVLIKAAFGGGGRGMRTVSGPEELSEAMASARREAMSSFGNDTVILEKHIVRPRHIEVQIIGDSHGNLLSLGERECSVQRRFQKVIEETPSIAVTPEIRKGLEDSALALAAAVDYTNAGTVEFLLDADGSFYFLEVNPRLQVEHPVTEWVTGLDLVRLQLLAASGEKLPISQADVKPRGHSIEARVYAEDPGAGYMPGAGPLLQFSPPSLPWVRHDVGVYRGFEVPVFYDSLLAKIAVYGEDRSQAVRRLRDTLDAYVVSGVPTNLQMLRTIARDPDFDSGAFDTEYVGRCIEPLLAPSDELPMQALASALAHEIVASGNAGYASLDGTEAAVDVWSRPGPWRLGRLGMSYPFVHNGVDVSATVSNKPGSATWDVQQGEESFRLSLAPAPGGGAEVTVGEETWPVEVSPVEGGLLVHYANADFLLRKPDQVYTGEAGGQVSGEGAETEIGAPLPGVVAQVLVAEGDEVTARQTLVVLEAMKMEHKIAAPYDGVVTRVSCDVGMQVMKGAVLLEMEPPAASES